MGTRKKAQKQRPSRDPQSTGKDRLSWFYESRRGISVVIESRNKTTGEWIATGQTQISWQRLVKSAERCGWSLARVPASTHQEEARAVSPAPQQENER